MLTQYQKNWKQVRKQHNYAYLDDIKENITECWICNNTFEKQKEPLFHHVEPLQKVRAIYHLASNCFSQKKIEIELSKCIAVCHKCHKHIHTNYNNFASIPRYLSDYKQMLFELGAAYWKMILKKKS